MTEGDNKTAIVGAGLVGSGWAIVFARAGHRVRVFDESPKIRREFLQSLDSSLQDMKHFGLIDDPQSVLGRIEVTETLESAVAEATYIQESVLEQTEVKQQVSAAISAAMRADAMVGSSSSGIPASKFTAEVPNRGRFIVAHPVNPPHLVPLVELVKSPWTDPEVPVKVRQLMKQVGQAPIYVNREINGFVLNRLQGALLNEAWALAEAGISSIEDIDLTVSHGLGLRWSFMGPFETIDLNAPEGLADYAERLGSLYYEIAQDRSDPKPWSKELIDSIAEVRRAALRTCELPSRRHWRDRRLMALTQFKASQP